jgi:NitT/TauT family transport system substrate-binding protein
MRGHPFRRLGLIAALVMLLAIFVAACGDDDDDDSADAGGDSGEVTEVKIGTQPWIGYGPFYIADDQGFDTDHGVNIELVNFSTDQDLESGFASGRFQAANNANNTLIRLADLGLDYKIVLMEDFSLEADAVVSCNPDIRSIEDLADAEDVTVAFEEFSVSDVLFRHALSEAGVDFESLDYTPIPAADAGTAAVAGRVDVAVTYEPYLQAALEEGDNCEIIYTAAEREGLISDALAINTEFAESDPEAVGGVLQAWGDAIDYYNSNTEDAQAIIAENVGERPEALTASFKGIQLFDLQESQDYLENDYEALWNDIRQIMVDQGQIESEPEVSDYLDTSFGEDALASE